MMDNILDPTFKLQAAITEKHEANKRLNDAINSDVCLRNRYLHKSNDIKLHPDKIKEELGLNKLPTEKQTQAFIEEKLSDLKNDVEISKENVASIKREIDLLDDWISLCKYELRLKINNGVTP